MIRSAILLIACCSCVLATALHAGGVPDRPSPEDPPQHSREDDGAGPGPSPWTIQLGIAMVTSNAIGDLSLGKVTRARGDAGGEMYLLGVSHTLHDFDWRIRGRRFRPQLELPVVLGVVDEGGRNPFLDYNAGITLRWKDFPFNRLVYTNLESGVGLSYTEHVLAIERQRHPDRDRSHLKFYWPIQLTLALPEKKQHQLVVFIHHQSGGHVFDEGGSNLIGIGYRHVFRERPAKGIERSGAGSQATARSR